MDMIREQDSQDSIVLHVIDGYDVDASMFVEGVSCRLSRKDFRRLITLRDHLMKISTNIPSSTVHCTVHAADWLRAERAALLGFGSHSRAV